MYNEGGVIAKYCLECGRRFVIKNNIKNNKRYYCDPCSEQWSSDISTLLDNEHGVFE